MNKLNFYKVIILLIVSVILTSISPFVISDTPTKTKKYETYKYEFGLPLSFVEQEVRVMISHGQIDVKNIRKEFNPIDYQFNISVLSYFVSVLIVYIVLYLVTSLRFIKKSY